MTERFSGGVSIGDTGAVILASTKVAAPKVYLSISIWISSYERGLAPLPLGTRRPRGRRGPDLVGVLILVIVVRGVCGPALLCWRIVVPVLISAP